MKKKLNLLTVLVFLTVMGSTAAIAGIFVTVPPIPRTRSSTNRPPSNPFRDSVRVGCNFFDLIWTFKANAEVSGVCPGFNVKNKIRWDWLGNKMSTVMSSAQTDGDLRTLRSRVLVTGCNTPTGIHSDTVVVNTPCQTPGGDSREFYAVNPSSNKTQAECEAVGWSFTSGGTCQPNESACVEAGSLWNSSTSTCGPTQSDCVDEGGSWNSFTSTCSGFPGPSPEPTPTPTPEEGGGSCPIFPSFPCEQDSYWDTSTCACEPNPSPILIDVAGNGFSLTSASNGVTFDLNNDGTAERLSWTTVGSDDAWLVLDLNGNGKIDNGQELFGNFTPQPAPPTGEQRNGFLALAEYDRGSNGGNGDGVITADDSVFSSLRLWLDFDHNGVSHRSELMPLFSANITTLELRYKTSKYVDLYGNAFRYRAKVNDIKGAPVGRWMWDVYLLRAPRGQ